MKTVKFRIIIKSFSVYEENSVISKFDASRNGVRVVWPISSGAGKITFVHKGLQL